MSDAAALDTLYQRGLAEQRAGRHKDALRSFDDVLKRGGGSAVLFCRLGESFEAVKNFERADEAYFEAIRRDPDCEEAYRRAGALAKKSCALAERVGLVDSARELRTASVRYFEALGVRQVQRGAWRDAEVSFREARAQMPSEWSLHVDHGRTLSELGRHEEAEAAIRTGLGLRPQAALAHYYLGLVLRRRGRAGAAEAALRQSLALDANFAHAHAELGNALFQLGRADEAEAAFARARALQDGVGPAERGLYLLGPIYRGAAVEAMFERHAEWGTKAIASAFPSAAEMAPFANAREPGRRLRVGYVSPDLHEHSVAYFLEPLLAHHDKAAFEVFCYADLWREDATTARLKRLVAQWRPVAGMTDEAFRRQIRADGIDILVDLAGHMDGNRLSAFAIRPAPVTATWLGYPATTGLTTIDWRITDDLADPEGAEAQYTERLMRLAGGFLCYRPADDAPAPAPSPAVAAGHVTFGSFNNLLKITPAVVAAWAGILRAVPASRLVIKTLLLADEAARGALAQQFADAGIAPERLDLRPGVKERKAHLALYGEVDVALDTFPYNGTTTTCEALWMGVPVVTLAGDRHSSLVGRSLLHRVDLDELVAPDPRAYVETAARLARDIPGLAARRATLRAAMAASPLCDAARFAREFEEALRAMWAEWCQGSDGSR